MSQGSKYNWVNQLPSDVVINGVHLYFDTRYVESIVVFDNRLTCAPTLKMVTQTIILHGASMMIRGTWLCPHGSIHVPKVARDRVMHTFFHRYKTK